VVEGLDAAGMLRQKGLTGARARRRGLSDSALGETRRQLDYKTGWYGFGEFSVRETSKLT
jgi:putative transposase